MTQLCPARSLDSTRYAETFSVFVSRSREYAAMLDRLVAAADSLSTGFDCLDVGAGTGKVVRDWLSLNGPRPNRYVAVEPNPLHVAQLDESIAQSGLDGRILSDPFHDEFPQPGYFDMILFSHSLYWMRDPIACVRHAYKWLKPGGVLLVFLQGPFGFRSLYQQFNPLLKRDRPADVDHGFSSHELMQGLRAHGLNPELAFDPTPIELTNLFDEGQQRERDEFISFVLQVEFSELSEPIKSDVIQCLKAGCVDVDGSLLWHHPNATIQIHCRD